jgi:hypothetical protein
MTGISGKTKSTFLKNQITNSNFLIRIEHGKTLR